jgi:hypothetical protein
MMCTDWRTFETHVCSLPSFFVGDMFLVSRHGSRVSELSSDAIWYQRLRSTFVPRPVSIETLGVLQSTDIPVPNSIQS